MLNKRRVVIFWILLVFAALSALVLFFATQPMSLEHFMDRSIVMLALVSTGLMGVAFLEFKASGRIRISKHYSLFGPGYGLLTALKKVTSEMEVLRKRQATDEISEEELDRLEEAVTKRLFAFVSDKRWNEVLALKKKGREEEAKAIARDIRVSSGL
jgi:hypothetical protein